MATKEMARSMPDLVGNPLGEGVADMAFSEISFTIVDPDGAVFETRYPREGIVTAQSIAAGARVGASENVQVTVGVSVKEAKAAFDAADAAAAKKADAEKEKADAVAKKEEEAANKASEDASKAAADAEAAATKRAAAEAAQAKRDTEKEITYIVEADGPIDGITYSNFVGNKNGQESDTVSRTGPIVKKYRFDGDDFTSAYGFWSLGVGATAGETTTSITCRILMDGTEVSKQTSTGAYSLVLCNAGG
ncbi:hypothetical protein [Arthrobacter sp. STN4]|uniref:hypothetical protein n=1 Tax=Arthrobacter sp. STN4 TaxID=2923276 RepID=UPI002119D5EC|nr:hypothetical protein [Arthrobacter sp. STN4]MCQ9162969.1 hypothetical protein [Arthrobacter sp. STN4]